MNSGSSTNNNWKTDYNNKHNTNNWNESAFIQKSKMYGTARPTHGIFIEHNSSKFPIHHTSFK